MKYIGIDYGTKRTGVAVSDEGGTLAFPRTVLDTSPQIAADIVKLLMIEGSYTVVLGHSLDRTGGPNPVMRHIDALKKELETRGYTVQYEDERYSSQHSARLGGEGALHDASSAAVILQSYLDRKVRASGVIDPYTPLPDLPDDERDPM